MNTAQTSLAFEECSVLLKKLGEPTIAHKAQCKPTEVDEYADVAPICTSAQRGTRITFSKEATRRLLTGDSAPKYFIAKAWQVGAFILIEPARANMGYKLSATSCKATLTFSRHDLAPGLTRKRRYRVTFFEDRPGVVLLEGAEGIEEKFAGWAK